MGQDDPSTGAEDSTTITYSSAARDQATVDQYRAEVAAIGYGYYSYTRFFTDTFQAELGKILSINPDFQAFMYVHYAHIPTGSPGVARPLHQARQDLLDGRKVLTTPTDGSNPVVAFVSGADTTAYWANYGTGTGASYAVDYDLIDEEIELYVSAFNNATYKPVGIKIDYFNQNTAGYYEYEVSQRDLTDLDQDDVAFDSDANEQTVYGEFQAYWVQRLRERFGSQMIIIANGRGSITQEENGDEVGDMVSNLDGWYFEGFPEDCPFLDGSFDDADNAFNILYDQYTDNDYMTYSSEDGTDRRVPFFQTDLRGTWPLTDVRAKFGRAAALLFDGYWRYRPLDGAGAIVEADITDETWGTWVDALGLPSDTVVKTTDGDYDIYTRNFQGGPLVLTIDRTQSSPNTQFISLTIDGVAQ